jgi:hypothetical protein
VQAIRAPWTSASFLVYTGALTVLASALWLNSTLSNRYSSAGFVGWAALIFACAAVLARAFRGAGRPLLAGLFAFVSVGLFAVAVGAILDWWGWLSHDSPLHGFHWGVLLLELLTLIAALRALRIFRHPLLALAAAGVGWYFVTDVLSSGGNWSAWVSLVYGLVLLMVAGGVNRVYAFWLHVVSGLTIGGALLWFWHETDWNFILIGLFGLFYILFGAGRRRSSWTVLGTFGLFLTAVHFIDKWAGDVNPLAFIFGADNVEHDWGRPFGFVVLGLAYVLLGVLVAGRERHREA